jgi:hypothetical protein
MVPRNTSVVVQNMFSIAPKPLNAVNVVLNSFIDKLLGVIDYQMLTKTLQRPIVSLLGSSGVGMVDRALRYGAPVRVMGSAPRPTPPSWIDPAIPLQQAKNDSFASSNTASLPLMSTPQSRTHPS